MRKFLLAVVCIPVLMFLASCGDSTQAKIDAYVGIIEQQIERLNRNLNDGNIQNAAILKTYADSLKLIKPDMTELVENLKRDAEPSSPAILRFMEQLENVKSGVNAVTKQETLEDLAALATATESEIYNDSLVDTINVLADLSDGELPRRSAPEKTSDEKGGAGSQLVGNTRYGRWENRGGQSMWVWFAAYSMFNRPYYRPYYYHSWHYHRPWSYHHDYGRSIYSTRSDRMRSNSVARANSRNLKSYGSSIGKRPSSYARKSNSKFRPSRSSMRASRSSVYGSSHRTSSRSSRGRYGGK